MGPQSLWLELGATFGMLTVDAIAKIRRAFFVEKKPIKAICRELKRSRKAVRKAIRSEATEYRYVIRQDGTIVGEHARSFGRDRTVYDPWHYVPVLTRKPGALRNGAPFKNWMLPASLERVRQKLRGSNDGDRQMVAILAAALSDGLPAVEAACTEALSQGVHSSSVILNILARKKDPPPAVSPAINSRRA